MEINDLIFGEMTYDYQWEKEDDVILWGKSFHVQIIVQSEDDNTPDILDIQRDAYCFFKKNITQLENMGCATLLDYVNNVLEISECGENNFLEYNIPTAIFFSVTGEWGILFESEYDSEDGIALMFSDGQWVAGPQEILI